MLLVCFWLVLFAVQCYCNVRYVLLYFPTYLASSLYKGSTAGVMVLLVGENSLEMMFGETIKNIVIEKS